MTRVIARSSSDRRRRHGARAGGNRRHYPYSCQHGCASICSHGSKTVMSQTVPLPRRRTLLHLAAATALAMPGRLVAQERRFTIAFANLTEDPGTQLEGLGFMGE